MTIFRSIRSKILFPVFFMTVFLVIVTLFFSTKAFQQYIQNAISQKITTVEKDVERELRQSQRTGTERLVGLASRIDVVETIQTINKFKEENPDIFKESGEKLIARLNDTPEWKNCQTKIFTIIDDYLAERKGQADIMGTFFTVLDKDGAVIARTNNRPDFGDSQRKMVTVEGAFETKKPKTNIETSRAAKIALRIAVPIFDREGKVIGIFSGGTRFDTDAWVDGLKEFYGLDFTIFLCEKKVYEGETNERWGGTNVATTVADKGQREIGTILKHDEKLEKRVFDEKKTYFDPNLDVHGDPKSVFYQPLLTLDGNVIGILFVAFSKKDQIAAVYDNVYNNVVVTIVGVVLFGFLLFFIVRNITNPICQLTKTAQELEAGDFNTSADIRTGDELQVLGHAFDAVAKSLKQKTEVALMIAQGDLRTWVPLSSQYDILGIALINMRYGLYDTVKDLMSLSEDIDNRGQQIGDMNQVLVGHVKQSAEQLGGIATQVSKLNEQTKTNETHAKAAETVADSAQNNSKKGCEKMEHMVTSMNAITKSSNEIKNIIRVIDDIAFQTNLLALNAAVEAARAGTHGKGFAVVAEEVRNLASRSANAAKETAELIEASIRQVDGGNSVAHATAQSLNQITDEVETISNIITDISAESEKQTRRLSDMTQSIEQVSMVAQQNLQSIETASEMVNTIVQTAESLEDIIRNFKHNEFGKVNKPKGDQILPPSRQERIKFNQSSGG